MAIGEGTSRAWYVDAWAVRDGRIFASHRPAESINADSTIFLAVPDLEPVPVGRISTALRATRSGFQEGLRDEAGDEIPFDSVDQVRELCRRGFLGGGLGPGAPGVGPIPYPTPENSPGGAMLAELEYALEGIEAWDPIELRSVLRRLHGQPIRELVAYAQKLLDLSLGTWMAVAESVLAGPDWHRVDDARRRTGMWLAGNGLAWYHDADHHDIREFLPSHDDRGRPLTFVAGAPSLRPAPNDTSLAPLPLRYSDYPLTRLAELAIIASIAEDFARGTPKIEYIAATATWHMIRLAARRYPVAIDTERLMQDALREVARNAPAIQLPSAANRALDRWIHGLLEPGPRRDFVTR